MASALHPTHKIVLSSRDIELGDSSWQHAKSPLEALEMLKNKGVEEAIIGGGRAVAHSFMREHLVDYMVIDLQPVAFGVGTPVFGGAIDIPRLKLLNIHPLNDDALRLRYQVLRDET
jgi:dihydrofolate reductase